ncbi:MAG TPA: hypothetical protein VLX92_25400 [Kofleriaceae bacterium]|nr:hypothetical protein [Kofleriaceae bacterium]
MTEFLEPLDAERDAAHWLVRDAGALRAAWTFDAEQPVWLDELELDARRWRDARHPRIPAVRRIERAARRLTVVLDDDRGPSFVRAAGQLDDPDARERWAAGELAEICDALAAIGPHGALAPHSLYVAAGARVMLRPQLGRSRPAGSGWLGHASHLPSARWLSPEQVLALPAGAASDVFQLATQLYCAIARRSPLGRPEGDFAALVAIRDLVPEPPPARSPGLAAIVLRGLAKRPGDRYADPAALGDVLRGHGRALPAELVARLDAWRTAARGAAAPMIAGWRCRAHWDELAGHGDVRHCATCNRDVVRVTSLDALVPLLGRGCVSYDPDR